MALTMTGCKSLFASLMLMAAATCAYAEPHFAVQQGLKCGNCHVNPQGGGLRNAFGNTWVQGTLAERAIDVGEPWTGMIGRFVSLGANVRADATYLDVPDAGAENFFELHEARLYLDVSPIPERLSIYLDQRVGPGGSENLEAYGRLWWGDRSWYVQAGQMYLPHGFRFEDDTTFVRQVSGINFTTPDQGLALGYERGRWSAQVAASNGTAAGPEVDDGKQWSARVEHVQSRWRLGASYNHNSADAGDRRMPNLFAGVRTGPIAWLAEADYIEDTSFPEGKRKLWAGLLEANWQYRRGHNLKGAFEFFDPDDNVDEDEQNRYSLVWEYVPVQFFQLRIGARVYDGIPQNDQQNRRVAFAQLHAFF